MVEESLCFAFSLNITGCSGAHFVITKIRLENSIKIKSAKVIAIRVIEIQKLDRLIKQLKLKKIRNI
jgi:hypothetical protein